MEHLKSQKGFTDIAAAFKVFALEEQGASGGRRYISVPQNVSSPSLSSRGPCGTADKMNPWQKWNEFSRRNEKTELWDLDRGSQLAVSKN